MKQKQHQNIVNFTPSVKYTVHIFYHDENDIKQRVVFGGEGESGKEAFMNAVVRFVIKMHDISDTLLEDSISYQITSQPYGRVREDNPMILEFSYMDITIHDKEKQTDILLWLRVMLSEAGLHVQ